jgi:hypothetical protein
VAYVRYWRVEADRRIASISQISRHGAAYLPCRCLSFSIEHPIYRHTEQPYSTVRSSPLFYYQLKCFRFPWNFGAGSGPNRDCLPRIHICLYLCNISPHDCLFKLLSSDINFTSRPRFLSDLSRICPACVGSAVLALAQAEWLRGRGTVE